MAKKTTQNAEAKGTELVSADVRTVVAFGAAEVALAHQLGLNLEASADVRTEQAVFAFNVATHNLIQAGLLLASVKAEMEKEAFEEMLAERGLNTRRAYELIQGATFCARLPESQRVEVMAMHKSKVLALASADPEVVESLLEDEDIELGGLSVRALRDRIHELEAENADKGVQLETAQNQVKAAQKAAARALKDHSSEIPLPVFDVRQEMVALIEKGHLSLESMQSACTTLAALRELADTREYVEPTARLGLSGLLSLRLQIDGLIHSYVAAFELETIKPDPISYLRDEEVELVARKFADLIALHKHEAELRDWHRKQDRPRGKGRPESKPEAPKTTTV